MLLDNRILFPSPPQADGVALTLHRVVSQNARTMKVPISNIAGFSRPLVAKHMTALPAAEQEHLALTFGTVITPLVRKLEGDGTFSIAFGKRKAEGGRANKVRTSQAADLPENPVCNQFIALLRTAELDEQAEFATPQQVPLVKGFKLQADKAKEKKATETK